jgi:hypothetical protein
MNKILPGAKVFRQYDPHGTHSRQWKAPDLNLQAKVVCEPCNGGWMSNLETNHAKPALADLILGKLDIPISKSHARSIAIFAFKTAVVLEYMTRNRSIEFFPRAARYTFKSTLEIPHNVQMWLAGYTDGRQPSGACFNIHHDINEHGRLEFNVCNYRIGHFAFQVVVIRKPVALTIIPESRFDHLAVPFWPTIPAQFVWPPSDVFRSPEQFRIFGERWHKVRIVRITGD